MEVDRTIWTYWHQGYDAAPNLVKACIKSWVEHNPNWDVVFLDRDSVTPYVDLSRTLDLGRKDLTVQKISDLTRFCLLEQYGGVWADATIYCTRPLDAWLPEYVKTGFFAFRYPGPDRLMATWFLAAERGNLLVRELQRAVFELYQNNRFTFQDTAFERFAIRRLAPILNVNPRRTGYWLPAPVLKLLRIYPYFAPHYVFNKLINDNAACREIWQRGRCYFAEHPCRLLTLSRQPGSLGEAKHFIATSDAPVYKLNWRARKPKKKEYWSGVLAALEEHSAHWLNRLGAGRSSSSPIAPDDSRRRSLN